MSTPFSRTLRSLEADAPRGRTGVLLAGLLLLGGVGWFAFGRVTVYERSDSARLEVQDAAHPIAAAYGGKVARTYLTLGREVAAGEVLVELDAEVERLALAEHEARLAATRSRLDAVAGEVAAEQRALEAQVKARAAAVQEAAALRTEAAARTRFAEAQAAIFAELWVKRSISELEYRKGLADADASRAAEKALASGHDRSLQDRLAQEGERQTRLAKLRRDTVELEGEVAVGEARVRQLEHEIELRVVRAPVAGRVAEVAELRVGTVVRAADRLGAIVPAGEARVVGLFPAAAVGRLRPGQAARVRLDGFPWAQYGTLRATVADVGSEARDGRVRVEFTLTTDQATTIPREHGLPGTVEVAVESVSPAALLLRGTGQFAAGSGR